MALVYEKLRRDFSLKRTPINLRDGGVAFIGFLSFASGDSPTARVLQDQWATAKGRSPRADMQATAEETGEFIDWLIETQWGEEPASREA